MLLTFEDASYEGVASVTVAAATNRVVIDDLTARILTASARTRITATLVDARLVQWTLGVHNTLWSTTGRRPDIVLDAGADSMATDLSAYAVGSTWRWLTWVLGLVIYD